MVISHLTKALTFENLDIDSYLNSLFLAVYFLVNSNLMSYLMTIIHLYLHAALDRTIV
jgi:hypothetical protein